MAPVRPPAPSSGPSWWLIVLIAAVLVGAFYAWRYYSEMRVPPVPTMRTPPTAPDDRPFSDAGSGPGAGTGAAAQPGAPAEAPIAKAPVAPTTKKNEPKYPLPESPLPGAAPLPALEQSDSVVLDALLGLARRELLAQFLNLQDFIRRFVITVDNLPRQLIPAQYSAVRRIPGELAIERNEDRFILRPDNAERYKAFVRFAEALDPKIMVTIYLHFYPLLQQEYRAMGFADGYFNDRVVEAIDDMLAAPEVKGPIRLVQPQVHYRFADPGLESLSAGRKLMIRIGPENAARLKQLLLGIRAQLVR